MRETASPSAQGGWGRGKRGRFVSWQSSSPSRQAGWGRSDALVLAQGMLYLLVIVAVPALTTQASAILAVMAMLLPPVPVASARQPLTRPLGLENPMVRSAAV